MLWPSSPHELYHVTLLIVHSRMALLRYSLTRMGLQIIILLAHIARAEDATKLSPTQKLIHMALLSLTMYSPADVASVRKSAEKSLRMVGYAILARKAATILLLRWHLANFSTTLTNMARWSWLAQCPYRAYHQC